MASLIDDETCRFDVLDIIDYRQRRNYAAYRSHRKRTLHRHQKHAANSKKPKVS